MKNFAAALALIALVSFFGQTASGQYVATSSPESGLNGQDAARTETTGGAEGQSAVANSKVRAKFSALFAGARDQKWVAVGNCYHVSFNHNGRKARAVFTQKGVMNYLLTELRLEQLPEVLRSRIAAHYKGYALMQALEITAYDSTAYQVMLENALGFVTLKLADNTVEEIDARTKAK